MEIEGPVFEVLERELFLEELVERLVEGVFDEVADGVEVRDLIGNSVENAPEHCKNYIILALPYTYYPKLRPSPHRPASPINISY